MAFLLQDANVIVLSGSGPHLPAEVEASFDKLMKHHSTT